MIEAYVDGSFGKNSEGKEIASWAFVIVSDGEVEYEEYGNDVPNAYLEHRNVAGEIFGVQKLLSFCLENDENELTIHYDYEGLEKWATGAWKTNKELTKQYAKFVNDCGIKIKWVKVVGHSGDTWNDYVDNLAKGALNAEPVLSEVETEEQSDNEGVAENVEEEIPVENMEPPTEIIYNTNPPTEDTLRPEFHINTKQRTVETVTEFLNHDCENTDQTDVTATSESINSDVESPLQEKIDEAKALCEKNKYIEAATLLRPFINKECDEKLFKTYIDIIVYLGDFYAKKAVTFCEAYLPGHKRSKVLKSYCYALYFGFVRPVVACSKFDLNEYMAAKGALLKILSVSKNSKIINDFVYPFVEYAYRIGDKTFIKNIYNQIDIEMFSREKMRIGNRVYLSPYDRTHFILKNL